MLEELLDPEGPRRILLVGDSAATVIYGYDNTVPVTIEELLPLVRGVVRGSRRALVVADLDFHVAHRLSRFVQPNLGPDRILQARQFLFGRKRFGWRGQSAVPTCRPARISEPAALGQTAPCCQIGRTIAASASASRRSTAR